jgi:hypothetical protein
MIFKDEAAILSCRWRALRTEDEIEDIAAQTAVALAREEKIPTDVIDALDGLMRNYDNRGRAIIRIVRYIDSLVADREPARTS